MASDRLRVVIAGGGTGGHLYPGVAVARELLRRQPDAVVTFAGTAQGIEARVVPKEGFALDVIRSSGLKGKGIADRWRGLVRVPLGLIDAWRLLSARRPHLVVGVGGYSSGPIVATASIRRIPTMLLEQNAVPGLTNRLLSRLVRAAAVTYDSTKEFFGGKAFVSGNPVREEFFRPEQVQADEAAIGRPAKVRVLVFGGSQGAHAINVAMVEAASQLAERAGDLAITHQTGARDEDMVRDGYAAAGIDAVVAPFLYDMGRQIGAADVVICRAGATTLAEIAAAGKPAILIPLPTATDDHQRKNAEALAVRGAADVLLQREATGAVLAGRLLALAGDRERRERMSRAVKELARPDAAAVIVDRALELAGAR